MDTAAPEHAEHARYFIVEFLITTVQSLFNNEEDIIIDEFVFSVDEPLLKLLNIFEIISKVSIKA